jgi:membrane fusion protein, multidrug efflux system
MTSKSAYCLDIILCLSLLACSTASPQGSGDERAEEADSASSVVVDTRAPVRAIPVYRGDFPIQMLTNGTITADQQVEIKIRSSGRITALPVIEGQFVRQGDLLCRQDDEALQLQLEQNRIALEEARVKLDELLILQGGEAGDTTSIAPVILKTFKITSGWNAMLQNIRQTEYQIRQTRLYAPFSGLIARRQLREHQEAQAGEVLCTLINPESYEVTFTLLEKDAPRIRLGQGVRFLPFNQATKSRTATIYRIDPVIDEHGLLTVRARITGSKTNLYTGMKARVSIEDKIPGQLIVPRDALVLRSNREVIFTADTLSGLAKWKYVTVGYRNEEGLTITEGLEPDDLVIVEGNLNLAHDAEIVINFYNNRIRVK